ncbi:MAG: NupC/NupG family nucleoside CNT transporter [Candidatus Melainabacteria bacterium]|nr:NupC/NupG family nucleoside CNT transporter [Candidatus Melainabacteria bacterium]
MDLNFLEKFTGVLGIAFILLISYLFSNNRKKINLRLVIVGLLLQILTGIFILKVPFGRKLVSFIARGVTALLEISQEGGKFVFGFLANEDLIAKNISEANGFIFAIQVIPTIIFICALVSMLYYFGILQVIVKFFAWFFNKLLSVSGAEALANSAVVFVGQVESAIVIQPYLPKLTKSEILTIMTGGMACISGSLMAIYSGLGVQTEYLLAASFMAAPGSFVISKIFYPEDGKPVTKDYIKIEHKQEKKNLVEAILDGAFSGVKISVGIIAMLLAFISLIALIDTLLLNIHKELSLKTILGYLFTPFIYLLGVPKEDAGVVAALFGTKISLNEFIAYLDLSKLTHLKALTPKGEAIATFILCGFANFSSIAIQVGGLSQMAPERKSDLSALGFKAMVCGALVSCVSGCIVGILL